MNNLLPLLGTEMQIKNPELDRLKRAVEIGYVLVKFTETQGGTELGGNLKKVEYNCFGEINENENILRMKGFLKLDYTPVLLHATVQLDTFQGTGFLEVLPQN